MMKNMRASLVNKKKEQFIRFISIDNINELHQAYGLGGMYSKYRKKSTYIIPLLPDNINKQLVKTAQFLNVPYDIISMADAITTSKKEFHESQLNEELSIIMSNDNLKLSDIYNLLFPGQLYNLKSDSHTLTNFPEQEALVICIGEEGLNQGLKYAILSGRAVVSIKDLTEIKLVFTLFNKAKSYYIAVNQNFTVSHVEEILTMKTKLQNQVPIGFFYPFDEKVREFFLLKSYLFSEIKWPEGLPYNFFYPLEHVNASYSIDSCNFIIGKGTESFVTQDLLKKPAEIFFATPHSNGVDMSIGNTVLCSKLDFQSEEFVRKVMPCFNGAICSRKTPNNELLSVSEIKSIIVFLYTCWGVLLKDSVYDEKSSLAYQFAKSPYNAILLSTYAMSLLDRISGPYVADLFSKGYNIGKAITEFNTFHYSKYQDTHNVLFLFGDPEFRNLRNENKFDLDQTLKNYSQLSLLIKATINNDNKEKHLSITEQEHYDITKKQFRNLDYSRMIVNGTSILGINELETTLKKLQQSIEELWMFMLLYGNRLSQKHHFKFNLFHLNKRLEKYIHNFQLSWFQFYKTMSCKLGGYTRFQVDRYFSLAEKDVNSEGDSCPYCHGPIKVEKKHLPYLNIERRLIECLNCATIFDGLSSFYSGFIECDAFWNVGSQVELKIQVNKYINRSTSTNNSLLLGFAGAILEPFDKKKEIKMPNSYNHVKLMPMQESFQFTISNLDVDMELVPGCYHLNCIILLNEELLFLRRPIYIQNALKF